jgi:hypothetical protein
MNFCNPYICTKEFIENYHLGFFTLYGAFAIGLKILTLFIKAVPLRDFELESECSENLNPEQENLDSVEAEIINNTDQDPESDIESEPEDLADDPSYVQPNSGTNVNLRKRIIN